MLTIIIALFTFGTAQNIPAPSIGTAPVTPTQTTIATAANKTPIPCIQENPYYGQTNGTSFNDLNTLLIPAQSYYLVMTSISLCGNSQGFTGYKTTIQQTDPSTQATSKINLQNGLTDSCQTMTLGASESISQFQFSSDSSGIKSITITSTSKQTITIGKQLTSYRSFNFTLTQPFIGFKGAINNLVVGIGALTWLPSCVVYPPTTEPPLSDADSCVIQPFCKRQKDCCSAHSECFSMCCSQSGMCIETKFCYSSQKGQLISTPSEQQLTPAVNSTTTPYVPKDSLTPCFQYSSLSSGSVVNGVYTVNPREIYTEPEVINSSNQLVNYKYAYGNKMSNAVNNPFTVQIQAKSSNNKVSSLGGVESAMSPAMDIMMPVYPGRPGYYYGGYGGYYQSYYEDPFQESYYKSGCDGRGYYSYQTQGPYSKYSAYYYNGNSYSVEFNSTSGQTCYYSSEYSYWSYYGITKYDCSRKANEFVMQLSAYNKAGYLFGFLFAFTCAVIGTGASCVKLHINKRKQRHVQAL